MIVIDRIREHFWNFWNWRCNVIGARLQRNSNLAARLGIDGLLDDETQALMDKHREKCWGALQKAVTRRNALRYSRIERGDI